MTKVSARHHYLPQCYLKGFLDNEEYLHVYDKKENCFFTTKGTNDVFHEKHRNSFTNPMTNEKHDLFEGLYTDFDTLMAPLLKRVIDSQPTDPPPLDLEQKWEMMLCLSMLYWRIPTRDEQGKELLKQNGFNSGFLKIRDKRTGEPIPDEQMKKLIDFDGIDKAYKMGMSFAPFYDKESMMAVRNWKFLYQEPGFYITGDNPILRRRDESDFKQILNEFVFPIASGRVLINNAQYPNRSPEREFCFKIGMAVIDQANRFVCGNDMEHLRLLVDMHSHANEVLSAVGSDVIEYLYSNEYY